MVQLNPQQTNICISHKSNTFDKKRMRKDGKEARQLRRIDDALIPEIIKESLKEYQAVYSKTNQ